MAEAKVLVADPNSHAKTLGSSSRNCEMDGSLGNWWPNMFFHSDSSSPRSGCVLSPSGVGTGIPLNAHFSFRALTTDVLSQASIP
jgi:hypothetical protein